jgi:dihydroflavonol-4-reductase
MNLVTGGTGFIGGRVVRCLVERGEEVRVLARPGADLRALAGLSYELCPGDILDRASLERAVRGCRRVFHLAAVYKLWSRTRGLVYRVNVDGTRNVIRASADAGVERIIHTSSVSTINVPALGVGTEEAAFDCRYSVNGYKQSKCMAEEVARELVGTGAPVVIVNPTFPVGEGDVKPTPTGAVIVDHMRGRMPAYVDTGMNVVDVDDVAEGHLLAAERGRIGRRYILGNENMTLRELLHTLAGITGRPAPYFRVPYVAVLLLSYVDAALARVIPGREPRISPEAVKTSRIKMFVDPSRAVEELGLKLTPVRIALEKAVGWFRAHGYA